MYTVSKYLFLFAAAVAGIIGLWSCNEDVFVEPQSLTRIRGQVLLNEDRSPVRQALVRLSPSGRTAETDSLGNFAFDSVLAGRYTVQVSKSGLTPQVATVETSNTLPSATVSILMSDDRTTNRPPSAPTTPSPAVNSVDQPNTLTLRWKATDPTRDTLTYDVLLFREGSATPSQTFTGLTADSLIVSNLDYNTTYLWQVIVKDRFNTVNGDVWSFRTRTFPNFSYVYARRLNGQFQLFSSNATTAPNAEIIQLTRTGSNWRPVVSPNGQEIAFISNMDTDLHLFVMNRDGSRLRRVTTVPVGGLSATDLSFCWSPDGTQLLYPSNDRLFAVRTDGTGLRLVAQAPLGRLFAGCDWTAQGNRIAARTTGTRLYDNEIVIYNEGGGANTILSRRESRVGNPVFSVNGQQLLLSIDVSNFQNEQGRQLDARIFLLDVASGGLTDLSLIRGEGGQTQSNKPAGTNDLEPRFSPNGAQVIFTNTDNTGNGPRNVFAIDLDGRNRQLLLSQAEMPYWR